jgi:hypothetical protein
MKDKLAKIEEKNQELRQQTIGEIEKMLLKSNKPEVELEPIKWGGPVDNPITVESITSTQIILFHNREEQTRVQWRLLDIDSLILIALTLSNAID